ncbi:pyrroloquinoline quinone biosynthesis peptide chaperone PqqD [Phyllobacterium myrsinacearum]|uniref:Pyrroloquinoline quinone biosynthesis protein D n=1 Tax=Phyllobacterium myrsinacearum TaxID=28101 RepID=A0A839ELM6_9HYPH|nr:pyrroloquinoline quinone biosynthesis peptide chaperone PqqD [Phyllobacterium myrsinacearum]MBA8881423.1 pyrroloquinoline quinone biosynthesis protein D [Phyllobacterium myrsinacearum]
MIETSRSRAVVSMQSLPILRRHVRLQYDGVREAWALLSPEKVFWPNEVSLDILRLCDGRHSVTQMIAILADQYAAEQEEIAPDISAFLQEWSDKFLVTL